MASATASAACLGNGRSWERAREALIDGRVAELSWSYFPPAIAEGTPLTIAVPH
jgi:hypothetical protein